MIVDPNSLEGNAAGNFPAYHIKYCDPDAELINVSDDEDLLTAYEVAQNEMKGAIKFQVELEQAAE